MSPDVLRRIAHVAHTCKKLIPPSCLNKKANPELSSFDYAFPSPQPINNRLVAVGLHRHVAQRLSDVYLKTATRAQLACEARFRRAGADFLLAGTGDVLDLQKVLTLKSALLEGYEKTLESWISRMMDNYVPRLLRARRSTALCQDSATLSHEPQRPRFNYGAVPMLEEFFSRNNRPSRSQKAELAEKTGMKYRQIDVWFQNRRSRCKKAEAVQTSTDCIPLELEDCVEDLLLEAALASNDDGSDFPSNEDSTGLTFDTDRPAHAFPSAYPPSCAYDPFPVEQDARSLSTPWRRKAATTSIITQSIDVDAVIQQLSRLTLVDQSANESQDRISGMAIGFATVMPSAPLPALLRTASPPLISKAGSCGPPMDALQSRSKASRSTRKYSGFSKRLPSRVQRSSTHPLADSRRFVHNLVPGPSKDFNIAESSTLRHRGSSMSSRDDSGSKLCRPRRAKRNSALSSDTRPLIATSLDLAFKPFEYDRPHTPSDERLSENVTPPLSPCSSTYSLSRASSISSIRSLSTPTSSERGSPAPPTVADPESNGLYGGMDSGIFGRLSVDGILFDEKLLSFSTFFPSQDITKLHASHSSQTPPLAFELNSRG